MQEPIILPETAAARDHWASDDRFPVSDWQQEVGNGDTRLGFAEWLAAKIEADTARDPLEFVGQDDRAASEGWCIIDNEDGTFSIEADSDSDFFPTHDDAEAFVKAEAAGGSEYHKAALARVGLTV